MHATAAPSHQDDAVTPKTKLAALGGIAVSVAGQIKELTAKVQAGEPRADFAVVASDLVELAQRSARAAQEIQKLIGETSHRQRSGIDQLSQAARLNAALLEQAAHAALDMARHATLLAQLVDNARLVAPAPGPRR